MTTATIKEKVLNIEAELTAIKKAINKGPNFDVDDKAWKATKLSIRKAGKKLYAEQYGKK